MTDDKRNKKKNGTSVFFPFILGGLFTYFIATPAIDKKIIPFFEKHFGKKTNIKFSRDEKFYNQINGKVFQYRNFLFKKYFDKNSLAKYKEYYNHNNRSNQLNPNSDAYWQSRGYDERPDNWQDLIDNDFNQTQDNWDNYSNQLNPNNDAYWQSRGYNERPDNWQDGSSSSNAAMDNHANQMNPNNSAYSSSRAGNGGHNSGGGHGGGGGHK